MESKVWETFWNKTVNNDTYFNFNIMKITECSEDAVGSSMSLF